MNDVYSYFVEYFMLEASNVIEPAFAQETPEANDHPISQPTTTKPLQVQLPVRAHHAHSDNHPMFQLVSPITPTRKTSGTE